MTTDQTETMECAYCHATYEGDQGCPPVGDDAAWAEIAAAHCSTCEWVLTRGNRLPLGGELVLREGADHLHDCLQAVPVDEDALMEDYRSRLETLIEHMMGLGWTIDLQIEPGNRDLYVAQGERLLSEQQRAKLGDLARDAWEQAGQAAEWR